MPWVGNSSPLTVTMGNKVRLLPLKPRLILINGVVLSYLELRFLLLNIVFPVIKLVFNLKVVLDKLSL